MHRIVSSITFALALAFASQTARAFINPPTLSPANPTADQAVSIDIYAGGCDGFFNSTGVQVTRTGSAIRMLIPGVVEPDGFCFFPPFHYPFTVGTFPAGSYMLQVDRQYQSITNQTITQTLGILPLVVSAGQASVSATPALQPGAWVILVMLLAVGGYVAIRRHAHSAILLLLALGIAPLGVRAQQAPQYLQVLPASRQGAPSPAQVVNYFSAGQKGSPPLQGLSVESPQAAKYLLPIRASGDFLTYLQANPESPRAKLERYVIVQYPAGSNLHNAMTALANDTSVEAVYAPMAMSFSSAKLIGFGVDPSPSALAPLSSGPQYGRDDLNIDAAWQIAGGYGFVGDSDSGLYMNHPALRQFSSTGQYLGGGFSQASSFDISSPYNNVPPDSNVDELKPGPVPDTVCNPNNVPALPPAYAGHGTHVSGLIAANIGAGLGVAGTCKHCTIGMWKIAYPLCNDFLRQVVPQFNFSAPPAVLTYLTDTGAQIVNMSFGGPQTANYCASNPTDPFCMAIAHATSRDVAMTGAAGNERTSLQFPASDSRVIDAGGFQANLALWDLSPPPPDTSHCPPVYPAGAECGSNYTTPAGGPPQEMMASANQVLSTTYPGYNWNNEIACGDQYPGPSWGNGVGWCTGTSMSAPQVAGVVGILRSINPLVPVGIPNPPPQAVGIRAVLARTTFEAQANQPLSPTFGYGHPDAAAAARKMLGTVAGRRVLNRVTPLFRLYSSVAQDYADTTSPQFAIALNINQPGAYQPQGLPVPGYASFPSIAAVPKASVYVLTTEYTPQLGYPPLIPIYQMDRGRNWPLGCTGGSGCNTNHRDFTLMTTTADIQQAHQDGFNLRAIQGYIYQTCTPDCAPLGAQKLYRECNTVIDDCATFLESERITFEGNGYTSAYPSTSSKVLGYAYPNIDTDGDGLVDGMEYVIGTSPTRANSDGTGSTDGVAYPQAGVPVSDPCLGAGAINCPANFIFQNGFQ